MARFIGRAKSAADFVFFVVEMVQVALEVSSTARRQGLGRHLVGRDRLAAIGTCILQLSLFPHRRTPFFSVWTPYTGKVAASLTFLERSVRFGVAVAVFENLAQALYELDEPVRVSLNRSLLGELAPIFG